MTKGFCHHCGNQLEFTEKVFRNDTCPACGSDIHCCLNCMDYDASYPNQCRESQAEKVEIKDRRNFCEYFRLRADKSSSSSAQKAAEAKRKLEALFSKKK